MAHIKVSEPVIARPRILPGDMVRATASVDCFRDPTLFRVKVWGQPPDDDTIFYTIRANSQREAAHRAIGMFVETMKQRREDRLKRH